jgi:hypothetical protein
MMPDETMRKHEPRQTAMPLRFERKLEVSRKSRLI